MLKQKLLFRILLNTALGIALVIIWSRFVNLGEISKILTTVELKFILVLACFLFASTILRALRLKLLLQGYKLPLKDIVMLNFLSQFLSFMVPIRAGEITKSVYLNSQFGLPLAKSIVWVFVDRFQDLWATIFLISLFLLIVPTGLPGNIIRTTFIILVAFTLMAIFFIKSQKIAKNFTIFLSNFLVINRLKKWFISFSHTIIEGFEVLHRSPVEVIMLLVISVVATISDSLIWFFVFLSLGVNFGLDKSILGNSLSALTFLIPAAPGYVGSAEAAGLAVFSGVLGMPNNLASAAVILFHIFVVVSLPVAGIISLYFLKFDLSLVWTKIRGQTNKN